MEGTKKAIEKLKEKGMKFEGFNRLELAKKNDKGIPTSTGKHTVELLRDEERDDIRLYKSQNSYKEVQGIRYWFDENGVEKYYDISLLDKEEEKPHYLLQKMAEFNEGDMLVLEYIQKGQGGYIDVKTVAEAMNTVDEEKEEVKPEDIPF